MMPQTLFHIMNKCLSKEVFFEISINDENASVSTRVKALDSFVPKYAKTPDLDTLF